MKKFFYLLILGFLVPVSFASAHVKWFVESEKIIEQNRGLAAFYYITSVEVIFWAVISAIVVLAFSFLERFVPEPVKLKEFAVRNEKNIIRIAQGCLGLFLISVSLIWKVVLIPELPVDAQFGLILAVVQVIVGVMYLLNIKPKVASVFLGLLYIVMGLSVGAVAMFENLLLISLAIFFYIKNSEPGTKAFALNKYAIEIVRISTGVSLIVLAFTEKLIYPELSLAFLAEHKWNFMQAVGFNSFDNNLFVLSVGFSELIFGLIFIFGYLTRINTILIACFFALSVVTMLVKFGAWEVEDLVVYSAAIIFLFFGNGGTRFFREIKK